MPIKSEDWWHVRNDTSESSGETNNNGASNRFSSGLSSLKGTCVIIRQTSFHTSHECLSLSLIGSPLKRGPLTGPEGKEKVPSPAKGGGWEHAGRKCAWPEDINEMALPLTVTTEQIAACSFTGWCHA